MATFFSASIGGFLDSALYSALPEDAVEINDTEHQALLRGQSNSQVIIADEQGRPLLAAPMPPSAEQLAVEERKWRDSTLSSVIWLRDRHRDELALELTTTMIEPQFVELLGYMQLLRDWPQSENFPAGEHRPVSPPWITAHNQ